jgi:3-deoxy-manno-octulosonate cytidylyltransferase (CMP-KDO synthetase)
VPNAIGIIPARYGSKRFPGKALALIAGVPLVVRVLQEAKKSGSLQDVIVATDDARIAEAVARVNGRVAMTDCDHPTGSDRAAEVARGLDCDYVVNIQGDEPFLTASIIDRVVESLSQPDVVMSSACSPFRDPREADNANAVKVVLDRRGDALYFSRSRIPCLRADGGEAPAYYRHIGIYGFKRDFLLRFAALERTPLEICESLEQLRALEHGYKIRVSVVDFDFVGIDTKDDLARAEEILGKRRR